LGIYKGSSHLTSDIQKIFNFIIELDKLKSVLRKTKPLGCDRYENSAEHSWQVCMLAVLLAKESPKPIDIVRVVEMLLVHDIPEIDAGDQIVYQGKDASSIQAETKAAERIFGLLPESHRSWCLVRWEEYEARQTDEAIFAYAVDRLMPVLQNLNNSGQSWVENRVPLEKILSVNAAIGNSLPSVWEYVRTLIEKFNDSKLSSPTVVNAQPNIREGQARSGLPLN
jgi:putative hydrolase of HD superfamily